jgi:hypothetical protein
MSAGKFPSKTPHEALRIVRMDKAASVAALPFLKSKTVIIKRGMIGVETTHVGPSNGDVLRRKIQDLSKLRFFLPKQLFGALSVLDVDTRPKPLDDLSVFVALRDCVVQQPAILAIRPPHACFIQGGFSTG